jgi:sigma-B regulation protein RsbU (phosphoserine phosphatase)
MATDPDSRRRLRLLNRGTHVAMAPLFLLVVASLVRWGADDITRWPPWVYMPTFVMVFVFPLTMAYVIVVERAMDVRVVLRQGVQYALARGGLRILQAAAVVAIIAAILELNQTHDEGLLFRIGVIAAGSAAVLLIRRLGPRLALAVDRRFFRDAYDAETILTELAEEVRTMVETQPLLRRVAECLSAALHVPRVALLVQRDGCYRPAFATGYDGMPEVAFPESAATVERLRTSGAPLLTHRGEAGSWLRQLPAEQVQECAGIENLGSELLLPLAAREKLLGMMSLGAKRSEEPFSPSDLRLLRSVAAQTGLALENSRLTDAIAREVAHSARERRELEIAREVQEQFFPHDLPPVAGLDYCGGCRPARHVGGDYYDFLMLAGFGFAIGDVSGKGVPAALLMAGLQASLRAHALQGAHDLAALMANVNRLVCDCSSPNRYATFFYGQIDPESRVLSYVNAGHNAPMIFRGGELLRLSIGGPVVGLLPMATYEQASLTLQPGDLIVGFTDGVSESMNAADEEWGEERLAAAVRACGGACAAEIVKRIMAEAEGFAAGAPQHDDMTLVVLRVT